MVEINHDNLRKFQRKMTSKFERGCRLGAEVLRDNTPIDTKRLWETTRSETITSEGGVIECRIVAGGEAVAGVIREQDVVKEVDYAIYVESRTNYAREVLAEITNVIVGELGS